MMHRPLRVRHVLGNKLELPQATAIVEERANTAVFPAKHEWVEVWGRPEAQGREACVGIVLLECFESANNIVAIEGRWVGEMRHSFDVGNADAVIKV